MKIGKSARGLINNLQGIIVELHETEVELFCARFRLREAKSVNKKMLLSPSILYGWQLKYPIDPN